MTLTFFSSSLDDICSERLLEPLLDRESSSGLRLVAPRPASRLFSSDGLRAQMNAWNDDTVNTPSLFRVCFVARETWASKLCGIEKEKKCFLYTFTLTVLVIELREICAFIHYRLMYISHANLLYIHYMQYLLSI